MPLGFTIGKEDRLYHIDPETAPIVQEIFSRYANGEPAEKIAASLRKYFPRNYTPRQMESIIIKLLDQWQLKKQQAKQKKQEEAR